MFIYLHVHKIINSLAFVTVMVFCSCTSKENEASSVNNNNQNDSGWISLFNGKTTAAWHTYGKDSAGSAWKAEDSVLHLDASEKNDWQTKNGGDIVSNDAFENFHLTFDWKISEGGNSGLMFYVNEDTSKYKYAWESGPELQLADNEKNEDGKIYKSRAGDLYELLASNAQPYVNKANTWNSVEVIADTGKLDEYMNGKHVLSTTLWNGNWKKLIDSTKFKVIPGFGAYKSGRIAFQDHGADIWFRNIKIKKLYH